jgi:hypothetical protein
LHEHFGKTAASDFGPFKLKSLRDWMITRGWCRTLVNRRGERIKSCFKWATSEEMSRVETYQARKPFLTRGEGAPWPEKASRLRPLILPWSMQRFQP